MNARRYWKWFIERQICIYKKSWSLWCISVNNTSLPCPDVFFFNTFIIYLFIYFLAVLGLRFCARAFSSCGKRGPLSSSRCAGLSLSRPLLLRSTGSSRAGSVVVAHGPSRSAACGILPDQGSNPCALHRQADSQPPRHQGSPNWLYF